MANKGILEALEDKILQLETKKKKAYLLAIEADSIDLYHGVLNKINQSTISELNACKTTESEITPERILVKAIPTKTKKGNYTVSVYLRNEQKIIKYKNHESMTYNSIISCTKMLN
jgi:hypothetical protein